MASSVLVTGATGKTGAALVERLRAGKAEVRTATRKPTASDDIRFEWRDRSTHRPALEDATAVYLVAPTDTTDQLPVMLPFLECALAVGVERFVLLSASIVDQGGPMMGAVHAWLAAYAPRWTVLRPSWFMQNFVTQHLPAVLQDGAIYSATRDGRVPFIDVGDIADAAARALTDPTFTHGHAPILTGPEALSYDEVAWAISNVAGRLIRHVNQTFAEMSDRYEKLGLPADYAAILAGLDDTIAQGAENRVTDEVELLSGHKPKNFATFLDEHRSAFGRE